MHVLISPDSYKENINAEAVAQAINSGIKNYLRKQNRQKHQNILKILSSYKNQLECLESDNQSR